MWAKVKFEASSRSEDDVVGNSPRVCWELVKVSGACQDGAREFAKRRPRLAIRLSGVVKNLIGSWEGIRKITRNTLGDRRRKTVRLATGNAGGCRIMGVRSLIKLGWSCMVVILKS
ncbi:hypothetical protein BHM03_00054941 [Ensete ventricosum]|nr:hypothetical protein BHM03_00054941 [Ensete ventricosum]